MTLEEAMAAFNAKLFKCWPAIFDLQQYKLELPHQIGLDSR